MRARQVVYAGLLGGVLALAACNESRGTGTVTTKTDRGTTSAPPAEAVEERDKALVRVINAMPGGPVSVWAGDSAAFRAVAYKAATAFREIPDDMFEFRLRRGGGGAESEPLATNREKLSDGGHYTIVALPAEGDRTEGNLRVLDDDLKPVDANKARVRVINAVPTDLEIDAYLRGREEALAEGVNFKTEAGWYEVEPGAGTLEIRPQGKRAALATLPNVKLDGGRSYTFVVAGKAAKPEIFKVEDDVRKEPS
jgi:hypothetical protein